MLRSFDGAGQVLVLPFEMARSMSVNGSVTDNFQSARWIRYTQLEMERNEWHGRDMIQPFSYLGA